MIVLTGCQNNSFALKEEITKIEVMKLGEVSPSPEDYKNKTGEMVEEITDQKEIDNVIKKLKEAKVTGTENDDMDLPLYKVNFINNNDNILTLGFYPEDPDREKSAFIDMEKEQKYTIKSTLEIITQNQ